MVYLDNNATTALDARVLACMLPYLQEHYGNASSREHAWGWDAADAVEQARTEVAQLINAEPREIVFTSGATEAIHAALWGLALQHEGGARGDGLGITAAAEHDAVLQSCRAITLRTGCRVCILPVDPDGRTEPGALAAACAPGRTRFVSLMLANNEIGTLQPLAPAVAIAHGAGAFFFSDLTQALGKTPLDVRAMGIDLAAFSAHKLHGPKGIGALYVRGGEAAPALVPLLAGGGQERGLRAGTLNVPAIVGFGEACRIARQEMAQDGVRIERLRDRLERELLDALPALWINGGTAHRLCNTSNIGFEGVDARALIRHMHDVAVSTRAACSTGLDGPSHVLQAIGLGDAQAYACIRFSLGRFSTDEDIDIAVARVVDAVRTIRRAARPAARG